MTLGANDQWPTSPILIAALTIPFAYVVHYYYAILSQRHGSPPTVWPTLPFIGDAFPYLYTPFKYFRRCCTEYGPVFRCLLGHRRMVVVCDDVGIQAVLRDKTRILSTYTIHQDVSASLGNISPKASRYLPDFLLPLSGDIFSPTGLMHITPALNKTIYYYVENSKLSTNGRTTLPLSTFVGEAIYSAVSVGVFGEQFPLSTFPDFETIDANFTNIVSRIPFLSKSTIPSREHMRVEVAAYIDNAGPECGIGTLPEPATKLLKVLADPQLTKDDRDALMVTYIWGLHSSTIRTAFWLFAYLLNDQRALNLVRDEIDKTVAAEFKDMDSLLDAPASALDGPGFAYLTSAVKEALRLSSVITPVREVEEDTFITLSTGETYPLRKGEFVTANIPMMHHYENSAYDNPFEYRVDRFLVKEGKKGPYLPWGSGEHICKGRYLAMHTLKIFTILVLRSLDVSAVTESGGQFRAPFVHANPTFLERWQMRTNKPIHIRVSERAQMQGAL